MLSQHARRLSVGLAPLALALACALPARAEAPTTTTSSLQLQLTDDNSCIFPIDITVDSVRRTTTYSNGNMTRHVNINVVASANGHADVETDEFDVFISAADPDNWKITGRFGQVRVDGTLVYVQSGLISFDPLTGALDDPHLGPLGTNPDLCTALAP